MTRSELVDRFHARLRVLTPDDAKVVVGIVLDAIADTLASGNRIEIRGFGSFDLVYRKSRVGRNPKSGDAVMVPERYLPRFKAGKELRERVDFP